MCFSHSLAASTAFSRVQVPHQDKEVDERLTQGFNSFHREGTCSKSHK